MSHKFQHKWWSLVLLVPSDRKGPVIAATTDIASDRLAWFYTVRLRHVNASCVYSQLWQMLLDGMHMVCMYVLASMLQNNRSVVVSASAFLATK